MELSALLRVLLLHYCSLLKRDVQYRYKPHSPQEREISSEVGRVREGGKSREGEGRSLFPVLLDATSRVLFS